MNLRNISISPCVYNVISHLADPQVPTMAHLEYKKPGQKCLPLFHVFPVSLQTALIALLNPQSDDLVTALHL